jgi:hypothetical protein
MTCGGQKIQGWEGVGGPRCGATATHRSPDGLLLCEPCARRLIEAAHADDTVLGILLAARGATLPPVDVLLARWALS